ncbi:Hypothetical predicted protein, partial [Podarcis lilfordi]
MSAQQPAQFINLGNTAQMERLNGKNYLTWALKLELVLKCDRLRHCVETGLNPQPSEQEREEDDRAREHILLAPEEPQVLHIADLDSAKQYWDHLCQMHLSDSVGSITGLTRRLHRTVLPEGGCLTTHLQTLHMLFLLLQRRGKRFPDLDQVYIPLSSLPPRFNIVIASLESM